MAIYTIQFKRGLANSWTTKNPILAVGEPGFETNTGKLKIGDGVHRWKDLPYIADPNASTGQTEFVVNAKTHFNFPSIGEVNVIYKASDEKKIYQWNPTLLAYEELNEQKGISIDDIKQINGGNANA